MREKKGDPNNTVLWRNVSNMTYKPHEILLSPKRLVEIHKGKRTQGIGQGSTSSSENVELGLDLGRYFAFIAVPDVLRYEAPWAYALTKDGSQEIHGLMRAALRTQADP